VVRVRLHLEARTIKEAELRTRAAIEQAASQAFSQLGAMEQKTAWDCDVEAYPADSPQAAAVQRPV
jgi:hypothetical protein